ncbi:hypothetical protein X801_08166, partial [Opisthorchis viverrini]
MLTSDPLLTYSDPSRDITAVADAYSYGAGAVVLHTFEDGSENAVAHAALSLTAEEQSYRQVGKGPGDCFCCENVPQAALWLQIYFTEPEIRFTLIKAIKGTPIAFTMIREATIQDPLL